MKIECPDALLESKLKLLKIPAEFPLEIDDAELEWHKSHLRLPNQHPHQSVEENHAHAVARVIAHQNGRRKNSEVRVVERHTVEHHHHGPHWGWYLAALLILLLAVRPAHCQYSQIDVIKFQNQGSQIAAYASPFTVNFTGAGVSCAKSGGTVTCTVTGGSITNNPGGSNTQIQYNSSGA